MSEQMADVKGRLDGQVAIVTGGTGGIGRAVCTSLAREGASLVVVDINSALIRELIMGLQQGYSGRFALQEPLGLDLDVRNEKDMETMVTQAMERFGRVDMLVHCAGILRGKGRGPKYLHQVSLEEWNDVVDTNLKGTFFSNRAVIPAMIQQRKGHIINFSSTSGLKGRALDSVYCATKFGVVGLSEALAEEVRQYGIRVHVLMPDAVDTPIWEQNGPVRAPENSLPPERVGDLVCYLAMLPDDVILSNLVIAPFQSRKRKKSVRAGDRELPAAAEQQ